jgi:hypothetical protein
VSYSTTLEASPVTGYSLVSSSGQTEGLSLASNGVLSGTPTTAGTASFVVRASNGVSTADRTFNLTINPPTPVFTSISLDSSAIVGLPYSGSISASDASSYSIFSGSLPNGITLNTSTGAISGTPTTPGLFSFVFRATNVTGSVNTETLTINIPTILRIWDGTAFIPTIASVWNGENFTPATIKIWNGFSWTSAK